MRLRTGRTGRTGRAGRTGPSRPSCPSLPSLPSLPSRPALLALLLSTACHPGPPAASATLGDIRISGGFAYEPIIPASGAAYFTVRNTGPQPDTLLGISSSAAEGAMLHGGSMAHLSTLEIPVGGSITLRSGDTHVMLSNFTAVPAAGDSLPLTLQFARSGSVTLHLPIRKYGE